MEENNVLKKFTTAQFLNFALGFFGLQFAWQMRIILSGPHIPMGAGWAAPSAAIPKNNGHAFMGSLTVLADAAGKALPPVRFLFLLDYRH